MAKPIASFAGSLIARLVVAAFVCLLWVAVSAQPAMAQTEPAKTNTRPRYIIYILADDLGWKDVGYHGSEIRTPNIDKLADSGAKLEQFYALPLCTPTRACLMTGRYPMREGLQTLVAFTFADYGLPRDERTLPQALKEVGYQTYIDGKWHLGHCDKSYFPMARGFDHQYGFYNGALNYFAHEIDGAHDWHRDQVTVHEEGYSTQLIGAEAVKTIAGHDKNKPLFLYVAFNSPHLPFQAPEDYIAQYKNIARNGRRVYAAMTTCMDDEIGKIIAAVDKAGMTNDTLIVFSSDNGGFTGGGANNDPLKGGKGTYYEGGMRLPCIASWPGKIKAGITINEPVHMMDWYPTMLTLAGASLKQDKPIDGMDIWPTLTQGKPTPHKEILLNCTPSGGSIRVGDWKLIVNALYMETDCRMLGLVVGPRPKNAPPATKPAATASRPADVIELYNIAEDPNETKNLAGQEPDKVKELRARLDFYARQAAPILNKPEPNDFQNPKEW